MKKISIVLLSFLFIVLTSLNAKTNTTEKQELEIKLVANKIQKCLAAFKKGYIQYPDDYTVNNCPNGWNCKINTGTYQCLNNEKSNRLYDDAIDWLNENGYDDLIDYWNDNNKSGQDI